MIIKKNVTSLLWRLELAAGNAHDFCFVLTVCTVSFVKRDSNRTVVGL